MCLLDEANLNKQFADTLARLSPSLLGPGQASAGLTCVCVRVPVCAADGSQRAAGWDAGSRVSQPAGGSGLLGTMAQASKISKRGRSRGARPLEV